MADYTVTVETSEPKAAGASDRADVDSVDIGFDPIGTPKVTVLMNTHLLFHLQYLLAMIPPLSSKNIMAANSQLHSHHST